MTAQVFVMLQSLYVKSFVTSDFYEQIKWKINPVFLFQLRRRKKRKRRKNQRNLMMTWALVFLTN